MPDTLTRPAAETDVVVLTDDGVRLVVRDYRPPQARHTVVFLHGLCLDRHTWAAQIAFVRRTYADTVRVVSYDHRGHGRSDAAPMSTYRVDRLAADLAEVLQACNVTGDVSLVGHSLGGMTALAYCGRGAADRPVEPAGLVLAATAAGRLCERGLGRLLGTPAPGVLCGLVRRAPDQLLGALTGPLAGALRRCALGGSAGRAALSMTAAALASVSVRTAVGFLPSLCDYDQYATLAAVRARTVVLSGGVDPLTPACHGDDLAAGIAAARHVHLPAAGHMLPGEAVGAVNDAVAAVIGPLDVDVCGVSA
jgi:pimeloyl-ACP methyl ester carboxylesterase